MLRRTTTSRSLLRCASLALTAAAALICGCGYSDYCARVDRTRRYLAHRRHLDEQLQAEPWKSDGSQLRVPKQFRKLSRDQIENNPAGNGGALSIIRRLEGLHAVWRADVAVAGSSQKQPAFLAVASNSHLRNNDRVLEDDVLRYEYTLVHTLYRQINQPQPSKSEWDTVTVPDVGDFAAPRNFYRFAADWTPSRGGMRYRVLLFSCTSGTKQTEVVFFLPRDIAASEDLTESGRIASCLETLSM